MLGMKLTDEIACKKAGCETKKRLMAHSFNIEFSKSNNVALSLHTERDKKK
jgi:hypothetical protein